MLREADTPADLPIARDWRSFFPVTAELKFF